MEQGLFDQPSWELGSELYSDWRRLLNPLACTTELVADLLDSIVSSIAVILGLNLSC